MLPNPYIAFFLSAIPGLGHIYAMGKHGIARGIVFFSVWGITFLFWLIGIGVIMTGFVWIWCAADAMGLAQMRKSKDGNKPLNVFGVRK
jgi:hypothetical protein